MLRSLESDPVRPNSLYIGPPCPPELHPQDGQLLMNQPMRQQTLRTWAWDVDKQTIHATVALRVLFENAAEYGSPYH